MPVILATDLLFFILLFAVAIYIFLVVSRVHMRRPWQKLAKSHIALVSITIMVLYIFIALLDSLHFKPRLEHNTAHKTVVYSNEVLSVLDWMLTSLRERQEKTYSSPFAVYAYVKESLDPVAQNYSYPRLKYGGSHLDDPAQRWPDIIQRMIKGTWQGLVASLLLLFVVSFAVAGKHNNRLLGPVIQFLYDPAKAPHRVVFFTVMFIIVTGFILGQLSSGYHLLGTDKVGEDVLFQAIKSIRTGILIGTLTTLVMLPFALLLGISAGYFLGRIDDVIQYIYTTLNSIPGVLLIAAAVLMLHLYMNQHQQDFNNLVIRSDTRLLFLCIILGITSWTGLCRLLRAETLKVKSMDYIAAVQVLGAGKLRIIVKHLLPNVMHIVFITIALDFSGLVLAEAVLSYVNIGVDPTMYSWGNMINSARLEMAREPVVWWSLTGALLFMFVLVLCANLFADAVRDAFDPRMVAKS